MGPLDTNFQKINGRPGKNVIPAPPSTTGKTTQEQKLVRARKTKKTLLRVEPPMTPTQPAKRECGAQHLQNKILTPYGWLLRF